jgi:CheY-like chemotaxis protein
MTRILSLDDNPDIAEMFRWVLQEAGYEVITTSDADEALNLLRTQPIDLFTQDLERPVMRGEELLRLLKDDATLRHIPVLLITGHPRAVCAQLLQKFGLDIDRDTDGYAQKGNAMGPRGLLDAVATVLEKHGKPLPPEELRLRAREW